MLNHLRAWWDNDSAASQAEAYRLLGLLRAWTLAQQRAERRAA